MKKSTLAIGILGGAAIGAALGILFAPAKGKETRKKIADKSNELASNAKTQMEDFSSSAKSQAKQLADKLARKADSLTKDGAAQIENYTA